MLRDTDSPHAPWPYRAGRDKRRARLNLISHMLEQIPYKKVPTDLPRVPKAVPRPKDIESGLKPGFIVPNRY
jgi:hypothetical protein